MSDFFNKGKLSNELTHIMKGGPVSKRNTTIGLPSDIVAEDADENVFRAKAIRGAGYARIDSITPADLGASKEVQREMKGKGILTLWRHPLTPNKVLMFMKTGDAYAFGGAITAD